MCVVKERNGSQMVVVKRMNMAVVNMYFKKREGDVQEWRKTHTAGSYHMHMKG